MLDGQNDIALRSERRAVLCVGGSSAGEAMGEDDQGVFGRAREEGCVEMGRECQPSDNVLQASDWG